MAKESFDFIFRSESEDEESTSGSTLYQDHQISSSRNQVTRESFTSSEMSPHSSCMSSMDSSSFGSRTNLLSSNKSLQNLTGDRSKNKKVTKSSYKTVPPVHVQNGYDNILDKPNSGQSFSKYHSDSDCSNEGYESGVAEKSIYKSHLCKECRLLYKKAQRARHSAEKIPRKPDPSHWCSKFWMLIPLQKKNMGMKMKQNRNLKSIVKRLRKSKPATKQHLQCSRLHSFLKRNLRVCTNPKKKVSKGRQKRKKKATVPKSQSKKMRRSVSSHYKNNSRSYIFALDSSEDDEVTLNVKRYVVRDEVQEMASLQSPRRVSAAHYSSRLQAADQDEDSPSPHINPQDNYSTDEATSSPFAHVQSGSFRELLERMNSGYLRSSIVNENRI